MKRRTESEVMRLARTVWDSRNDTRLWDGWRTYGDQWAWDYLVGQIRRGAGRNGTERPEAA